MPSPPASETMRTTAGGMLTPPTVKETSAGSVATFGPAALIAAGKLEREMTAGAMPRGGEPLSLEVATTVMVLVAES